MGERIVGTRASAASATGWCWAAQQPATAAAAHALRRGARGLLQYKVQQFLCYRSGLRRLLGEYGGIEADRQANSSRQQAAADS
jgi:predicted alpha/beta hydrolase